MNVDRFLIVLMTVTLCLVVITQTEFWKNQNDRISLAENYPVGSYQVIPSNRSASPGITQASFKVNEKIQDGQPEVGAVGFPDGSTDIQDQGQQQPGSGGQPDWGPVIEDLQSRVLTLEGKLAPNLSSSAQPASSAGTFVQPGTSSQAYYGQPVGTYLQPAYYASSQPTYFTSTNYGSTGTASAPAYSQASFSQPVGTTRTTYTYSSGYGSTGGNFSQPNYSGSLDRIQARNNFGSNQSFRSNQQQGGPIARFAQRRSQNVTSRQAAAMASAIQQCNDLNGDGICDF